MSETLVCWQCGSELRDLILPMSRREECAACNADQHVCKLCRHYDAQVSDQCSEDRAEAVTDKERANFCDYFTPVANAYRAKDRSKEENARQALADLFGDASDLAGEEEPGEGDTEAEKAKAELARLFGSSEIGG